MRKIGLGQALEIIASVGVLVGIVILIIEVGQNTDMLQAQMHQDRAETAMAQAESVYNSEHIPEIFVAIRQGMPLTDEQYERFKAYIRAFHRNQDNLLRQYQQGLLNEDIPRAIRDAVQVELAEREIAREIWERTRVSYTDDYVILVDEVIADYLDGGTPE